jgi:hypothetical protein
VPIGASANAVAVADGLGELETISPAQREQLLNLLGQYGDFILGAPDDPANLNAAAAAKMIKSHGENIRGTDRSVYFLTPDGRLELHDDHAIFHPAGQPAIVTSIVPNAVSYGGATPVPVMPPVVFPTFSAGTLGLSIATGIINLCLALYLVVIGIMTLNNSRSGRKLHLIYATIKLPVVIIGAIAGAMMMTSMMSAARPRVPMVGFYLGFGLVTASLPMIYPVALLIALNTRRVREWSAQDKMDAGFPALPQ